MAKRKYRDRSDTAGGYSRSQGPKEEPELPERFCGTCKHEQYCGWCRIRNKWVDLENPTECFYHKFKLELENELSERPV